MKPIPVNPYNPVVVFRQRQSGEVVTGIVESIDTVTGKISVIVNHIRYFIRPQHIETIQY